MHGYWHETVWFVDESLKFPDVRNNTTSGHLNPQDADPRNSSTVCTTVAVIGQAVVNLVNTKNSAGLQMHDCWHETAQTKFAPGKYKQCFWSFHSESFSSGWRPLHLLAPHTPSSFFAYAPCGDCMKHTYTSPMELACNPVFLKQRLIIRLQ